MTQTALWLSQAQFFLSLAFMLLFLLLEIGLAWALVLFRFRSHRADAWTEAYRLWARIFALTFILAFASTVPVMVQFGALWPVLMERMGNVAGPLIALSVLVIFVFKAGLVGAMLYGERRMGPRMHTMLVCLVAVGLSLAAVGPLMLFSWMRTPAGAVMSDGTYLVTDWHDVFFNPSLPWYAALFFAGAFATSSLFMLGLAGLQSLRRPLLPDDKVVFRFAARAAAVTTLCLLMVGAFAGRGLAVHEPARAAVAMGYWESAEQPEITLLTFPSLPPGPSSWAWQWRGGAALLAPDSRGGFRGVDQFTGMAPPLGPTFWSFRIAVGGTLLMLIVSTLACWRLRVARGDPLQLAPEFRRVLAVSGFCGWVIALAGFAHLVIGAYPYAVAGTVTNSEVQAGLSLPTLVGGGLALFAVYAVCMTGFFQLLWHAARYGVVPVARRRGRA